MLIVCNTQCILSEKKKNDFYELIFCAIRDGINAQTYQKRAILLKNIINKLQPWTELASGLRNIACSSTIEYIIRKIFINNPSLVTKETCNHCAYEKKRNNITISVNLPTQSLDFLNDALSSILQKKKIKNV
jgi:hypothetical protein